MIRILSARTVVAVVAVYSLLAPHGSRAGEHGSSPAGEFVDVHMHLDGVQAGSASQRGGRTPPNLPEGRPGMPPEARKRMEMRRQEMMNKQKKNAGETTASADSLIAMMDKYGVRKAIVMPPPQTRNQKGGYTYTALLDSIKKYEGRLVLGGGGGVLNPMIHETKPSDVDGAVRQAFKNKALEIVRAGAHVFGEMTALHVCMNPKHHYEASPPDHPLFLLLADIAAEHDIPIDLHMEAVAEDMPTPEKLCNACAENPPVLTATLPAFARLLEHNRKARIVWQHIGWDNIGQMTPSLMSRLFAEHPNLYIAIKAVPPSDASLKNRIHNDAYSILPEWRELFEAWPDRIVIGADEFARAENMQGGYKKPPFFDASWKALMSLPPNLKKQIGGENAARIYRL